MRTVLFWMLAPSVACSTEYQYQGASGVGNPVSTVSSRIAPAKDANIISALAFVDTLRIDGCAGDPVELAVGQDIDLLDSAPIVVPGGTWCGLSLTFVPELEVEGRGKDLGTGTFSLELDINEITLDLDEVDVGDAALIVEIGSFGWVGKEVLRLEEVASVVIDPTSREHDAFAREIEQGSALLEDLDRDGRVQAAERSAPLAAGPQWRDYVDE